ncbi:MAG TPA: biotin/lipoate A/B protein ligase family protein [Gemmataceae bacterium]|nr:biotin/lipoate A/B protein ligase family protein [Gemmataceae bacterium]
MTTCRLLPYAVADGPHNMAADEILLEAACAGAASLRFYAWSEATVSLGYFQSHESRLAGLPWVRRQSGGMTLVHHHEITYALALPAGAAWQGGEPWLRRMHRVITAALAEFGVCARLHDPPDLHPDTPLCFRHLTAGDLLVGGAKVGGSAQRKHGGALLQHGGLLLRQSPHTPGLPGIRELAGHDLSVGETCAAIGRALAADTGWDLVPGEWVPGEVARTEELVALKYGRREWNEKR